MRGQAHLGCLLFDCSGMLFKLASCQLLVWVFVVDGPVNLPCTVSAWYVVVISGTWYCCCEHPCNTALCCLHRPYGLLMHHVPEIVDPFFLLNCCVVICCLFWICAYWLALWLVCSILLLFWLDSKLVKVNLCNELSNCWLLGGDLRA
jgi:hypothetical protein